MKKISFVLGLGLMMLTACQQEDDFDLKSQIREAETIEVNANVGVPVRLEAGIPDADSYAWYVEGTLVSTASAYVFEPETSGKADIVLETVKNGVVRKVVYATNSTYSLAADLATYDLATNGITYNASVPNYYWDKTYSNTQFSVGIFTFSHTGGDVSGYNYWDGFTVSDVHDDKNYGTTSSSDGWIANQWGCMDTTDKGNFMLGYWGYYGKDIPFGSIDKDNIPDPTTFSESGFSNWVRLGDGTTTYTINSITVTNSPWAYYGCKTGDGFSTPFKQSSDYLTLKVYPVYKNNRIGEAVNIQLDGYNGSFWGLTSWSTTTLYSDAEDDNWEDVKYILFQMRSSDTGEWGMNTATYFCLKDIQVQ